MLTPLLVAVLSAAPTLTLHDSVDGGMTVGMLDDGRWLTLARRWARANTGDAADNALELDLYGVAEKKTVTFTVPMRPLHEREADLFVDATSQHPTRGKAIAAFELDLVDYRPDAGELSFIVKNARSLKNGTWKRRWIWTVLSATDGKVVRAHVLHEESGVKEDEYDFRLKLASIAPGGTTAWFHSYLQQRQPEKPGFIGLSVTLWRVDLVTGETGWSKTLELLPSNNRNRAGFRFGATDDYSALVLAEYSEAAEEPIEPRPAAYVVWPATGRVLQLEIPYTPYALAFDAKGETLVLGSNQARKLVTYRLSDGKAVSELATGEHLHRLYLAPGGTHVLVMYGGPTLEVRAFPALKPVTKFAAKSLGLEGFCGGEGQRSPDGRTIALPRCDKQGLTTNDGVVVLKVK